MTITDLKKYSERINAKMSPTDRLTVTLNREALTYVLAYLSDREKNLSQALGAVNISDKKREKRQYEFEMATEALNAIIKAKEL